MAQAWTTAPTSGTAAVLGPSTIGAWTVRALERGYDNPELSWEFFDGDGWRRLEQGFVDGTQELATSGTVSFRVPATLSATEIGGREDLWIRARLVGGDYGRPKYVVTTTQTRAPRRACSRPRSTPATCTRPRSSRSRPPSCSTPRPRRSPCWWSTTWRRSTRRRPAPPIRPGSPCSRAPGRSIPTSTAGRCTWGSPASRSAHWCSTRWSTTRTSRARSRSTCSPPPAGDTPPSTTRPGRSTAPVSSRCSCRPRWPGRRASGGRASGSGSDRQPARPGSISAPGNRWCAACS